MNRRRSQPPKSPGSSKAFGILNAHKPMPLSELFSNAGEDKGQRTRLMKYTVVTLLVTAVIALIALRPNSTSNNWMDNSLVLSLLKNTPKSKNNQFVVFVTHCNGLNTETHFGQSEASAKQAMMRAFGKIKLPRDDVHNYIKVDSVMGVESVPSFNYVEDTPPLHSGFAVGNWDSLVFLYEQVTGSALVDRHGKLRWDHIGKIWASSGQKWPTDVNYDDFTAPMDFIRTQGVFYDGKQVVSLLKGKRVLQLRDLTPQLLHESAEMAGDYLARQVHLEKGTMVYRYRPRSDTEPTDEYNLTRHAGTAYAMAVLYRTYKDPALLAALQATLDYLVDEQLVECPMAYRPSDMAKCIINEVYRGHKWTQLGVNSLGLLAMAEYMEATKDTIRYYGVAQEIAKWIGGTQHEDGSFVQDQDIETNRLDEESYVRYYPGEAAFAMARLYNVATSLKLNTQDSWKEVAIAAMDYIVDRESDVEDEDFVNDHWMMYAAAEVSPWHFTKPMLTFVLRTGRVAQDRQIRHHDDEMDRDRNGIYLRPDATGEDLQSLSSCATATKSEGLCAVYPAVQKHAPESAKMILDSVKWGIRYQLGAQFQPEQAMYMKKPAKILGAMAKNIMQTETRNDFSQHNLSSFLCLARMLEALEAEEGGASAVQ
mmetsp:Transcript_3038/g.4959  ORF Transcript_3038/g.4959 Transcript_3038/m.4959 type:complete len:651 (+) Transcript_3038:61-2013(+)|eukprot:CAMPEP_0119005590 /NCGR_PEP_ID=MMETSP1176-20130426/1814_1 /TAXON_ID=265551 /ORGANISM="Synedropsis recta cf, Strain CCMP1620" /LENGTH=650 /DNA_ID=CAMNT_0006957421 /DNA_START=22 /DNA_END=1974 /DNA_ORIENTATION=+